MNILLRTVICAVFAAPLIYTATANAQRAQTTAQTTPIVVAQKGPTAEEIAKRKAKRKAKGKKGAGGKKKAAANKAAAKNQAAAKKAAAARKKAAAQKNAAARKAAAARKKAASKKNAAARKAAAARKKAASKKAAAAKRAAAQRKAAAKKAAAAKKKGRSAQQLRVAPTNPNLAREQKLYNIKPVSPERQRQLRLQDKKRKSNAAKRQRAIRDQQRNINKRQRAISNQQQNINQRQRAINKRQRSANQQIRNRRKIQTREVQRNKKAVQRAQQRRNALSRQINNNRTRNTQLKRRNERLERQNRWLAAQRRDRRDTRHRYNRFENFGFRDRTRVVERRRDRTLFSAVAAAALGAAAVGTYYVYHNDNDRLHTWRSRDAYVEDLDNGWTRNVVIRSNGVKVVTIRDGNGFIVRRYRVHPGNRVVMLYDNRPSWWDRGDIDDYVEPVRYSGADYIIEPSRADVTDIYDAVVADPVADINRKYTLNQILMNANLRGYMPRIDLDTINFATGSSEIPEYELERLDQIGAAMEAAIKENQDEVYLIEGHSDATGDAQTNALLSDERAAAVANALTQYYDIPPENLVTQGYGEDFLKVNTLGPEPRNRRVAIRRITPLLANDSDEIALDSEGNEVFDKY